MVYFTGVSEDINIDRLREVPQPTPAVFVAPPGPHAHSMLSAAFLSLLLLHRHELKQYTHTGLAMAKVHDAELLFERVTIAKRFKGEIYEQRHCPAFEYFGLGFDEDEYPTYVNVFNFEIVHQDDATKFCFIQFSHFDGGRCFRLLAMDKAACRCALLLFASRLPHVLYSINYIVGNRTVTM